MSGTQEGEPWIWHLGDALICEILYEMSGIQIKNRGCAGPPEAVLDEVYGLLNMDTHVEVLFRAPPQFFARMAERMIGAPPEDTAEIREYACEVFNTICGRFVSEICRFTQTRASFYPVEYQSAGEHPSLRNGAPYEVIYFLSDQGENIEFLWSARLEEELLRRSGKQ